MLGVTLAYFSDFTTNKMDGTLDIMTDTYTEANISEYFSFKIPDH